MQDEEEEYWAEWKEIKNNEMLENVQVFLDQKHEQMQQINLEIMAMEGDSDDEYGIYQNFANTQAHLGAKLKMQMEQQKENKNKQVQKMLITTIKDK